MSFRNNAELEEARQRLQHLRTLPETPMRKREILSLERVLNAPADSLLSSGSGRKRAARRIKRDREIDAVDDEEDSNTKPEREVERSDTGHRVITRHVKAEKPNEAADEAAFKKEHRQRISDIQNAVGLKYRGFS
jgi:hypothetical protein